jgi:nucleotide-binding universal stress UspA family protein
MSYAAIMTQVQGDPEAAPRLACALDIARRFGAHLIGVAVEEVSPLAYDGGLYSPTADASEAMRQLIEERLQAARRTFDAAAAGLSGGASFMSGVQRPTPALAGASRGADLIVAGGAPRSHNALREISPGELAVTSGRPVLVAPPAPPPLSARQVLLAWKDTREARRAMSDAIPFFEQAERVVVAAIVAGGEAAQARIEVDDVAAALKRRGIKAEGKVVEHAGAGGEQILEQAGQEGADLIVCGAYGHSRLGEWAFGGVTQDLLSQNQAYLLLSH